MRSKKHSWRRLPEATVHWISSSLGWEFCALNNSCLKKHRNYCYASARVGNTVSIISIEDRKEIKRIPVGDYPQRMWTTRVTFRRVSR